MTSWPRWVLEDEPLALARYVLPDQVARQVPLPGPSGESRLARLRTVYEAIAGLKIGYAYDAPTDEAGRQVIRPPDQVLWAPRHATCLDLALILAGGCLTAGLHPAVVILAHPDRPGSMHALLLVRLDHDTEPAPGPGAVWPTPPVGLLAALQRLANGPPGKVVALDPVGVAVSLGFTPTQGLDVSFDDAVSLQVSTRSDVKRGCRVGMTKTSNYIPILKGKLGEFSAWRTAGPIVWDSTRPVFEVVPTKGPAADLTTFINGATSDWPQGMTMTVNIGALDQSAVGQSADSPTMWVARALHGRGILARPVVHLDDKPAVLAEAAAAHELHHQGACLRLGSEEEDPDVDVAAAAMPGVLATTGFKPADIDLLIDFQHVDSEKTIGRIPRTLFPPWGGHQGRPVQHLAVGVDLARQSRQGVLVALDLPPADLAVDDGDIDPTSTRADPQLVAHQRVDIA